MSRLKSSPRPLDSPISSDSGYKLLFIIIIASCIFLPCCALEKEKKNENVVFLIAGKLEKNESIDDINFLYQGKDLKNIFYPAILHNSLSFMSDDDSWSYIDELSDILVKDCEGFDAPQYYMIFDIAEKHIQYDRNIQNELNDADSAYFGEHILSKLTKLIECKVNNGNISKKELSDLFIKLEQYKYIPNITTSSKWTKLWRSIKAGDWEYIFKRRSLLFESGTNLNASNSCGCVNHEK